MKHILQSVIIEEPLTQPFRIVLHHLNGEKLCTHMEVLDKEPIDEDCGEIKYLYYHQGYCHGHFQHTHILLDGARCMCGVYGDTAMSCSDILAEKSADIRAANLQAAFCRKHGGEVWRANVPDQATASK